jgi:multiple sugar transport system ATP-binding protein
VAKITLTNVSKQFKEVSALKKIDLTIENKEFFVLFGPAGAGKTTLLKTIAGIERQDEGEVLFDDEKMNLIEPAYRNVSMVFENYALYPHLSVFENIASPMKSRRYREADDVIEKKVHQVADMMKIGQLLERLPSQLSNGQRQRVALGRSLVRNPNVFLMDEPLAHLDAKLRNFMRTELKEIQQNLDTTTVYVTHDYMEAMSLGDRIGIIDQGEIVQLGTAEEIYYYPCNEFVAKLLGEPEINLMQAQIIRKHNEVFMSFLGSSELYRAPVGTIPYLRDVYTKDAVDIGIRGTNITYSIDHSDEQSFAGSVYSFEPIGNKTILMVKVNEQIIKIVAPNDFKVDLDAKINITFDLEHAMFFDIETKEFLVRQNQSRDWGV